MFVAGDGDSSSNLGPLESYLRLGDFCDSLSPVFSESRFDQRLWALVHGLFERIVEAAEFLENRVLDNLSIVLWFVHFLRGTLENGLGLPLFLPLKHLLRLFSSSNSSQGEVYLVPLRIHSQNFEDKFLAFPRMVSYVPYPSGRHL